jgi:periplasmic protein TonB
MRQDGPADDPDANYLSRSQLTRAPSPQQSIDLLYPELAPSGHFRAVVTLFIDDRGVVQRVRIDEADDSGLPPQLEDATRQTFLRSTFAPGEVDGRPTRSRLRIEVDYAAEPLRDGAQPATR